MFGLDLPALPGSYLTRQVTCVSCQEPFVVSEGRVVTKTRDDGQRVSRSNWRPALDRLFSVRLRYEEDRYRQEVRSPSQAIPNVPSREPEENGPDNFINCPRCGADNRNWLQILSSRHDIFTDRLDIFLPRPLRQWRQRFPGAFLSIFLAILLGGVALLFSALDSISRAQALLMAFVAVVTAGLTASDLTSLWPQLRLRMHLRRFIPGRRGVNLESPIARGIILIILFAGIFPWLFFQAAPRAMQYGSRVTRPANRGGNSAIISDKKQPPELYSGFETSFNSEFASFFYNFSRMRPGNPQDVQFLVLNLNQLNTALTGQAEAYEKQLVAYLQDPPKTALQVQDEAEAAQIRGIADNLLFLVLWFVIVGFANVFAVLLSNAAVNQYVSFVDNQLPPPIFSNVANMTRVVTWEAKRALQIDGNMGHVQWMEVYRNKVGGINLVGLHRDVPELNREDNTFSQKVYAQRYLISTDWWGRIRDATILDERVSRTVMSPAQRQLERSSEQRDPPFIPIHSPPDPSGSDLVQDFFAASSASSNQPEEEVVIEAVTLQPSQHERMVEPETVSPQPTDRTPGARATASTAHLLIPQPIGQETFIEREERLCQGLALILNELYTEKELQQLYGILNMNYARLSGTRLEKCQDLVRFHRKRNRLADLVRECVDMYPNVLWGDILDLLE